MEILGNLKNHAELKQFILSSFKLQKTQTAALLDVQKHSEHSFTSPVLRSLNSDKIFKL